MNEKCPGPIASALVSVFGARPVSISGAIISSIALVVSKWTPNLEFLTFSVGIVCGKLYSPCLLFVLIVVLM